MTEPEPAALHSDYTARLERLIATRDSALATLDSTYATAVASSDPGDPYASYATNHGHAVAKYKIAEDGIRWEYARAAGADAEPLIESVPPRPRFPPRRMAPSASTPAALPHPEPRAAAPVQAEVRQRRIALSIAGGGILAFVILCLIVSAASNQRSTTSSGSTTSETIRSSARTVLYEVEGTATSVDITYEAASGTAQQSGLKVPLTRKSGTAKGISVTKSAADFVYISAQNQDDSGSVTCKITVDGVVVSTVTSRGAYTIATCSGNAP